MDPAYPEVAFQSRQLGDEFYRWWRVEKGEKEQLCLRLPSDPRQRRRWETVDSWQLRLLLRWSGKLTTPRDSLPRDPSRFGCVLHLPVGTQPSHPHLFNCYYIAPIKCPTERLWKGRTMNFGNHPRMSNRNPPNTHDSSTLFGCFPNPHDHRCLLPPESVSPLTVLPLTKCRPN